MGCAVGQLVQQRVLAGGSPYEWVGGYKIHQTFANVYYDIRTNSRWTPFVGVGAGWAAVSLNYYLQFVRKPEAEYLRIEFDPVWRDVAKRVAAGIASILDTYLDRVIFGYQALALAGGLG